jgi:hypothetical protein
MRFVALGIVSFVAVLMGALLAPGTFVNRALSTVLCTVFSFNWAACTANLAQSSDRVVAATPPALEKNIGDWLGQRSGEFDDDKPSTPPGNNPQVPPYPQDPGPNQPVRPELDSGGSPPPPPPGGGPPPPSLPDRRIDSAAENAADDIGTKFNCDKNQKPPIYAVYVNGVNTPRNVYDQDKVIINKLLKDALGEKVSLSFDAYNRVGRVRIEGIPAGDFLESAIQSSTSRSDTFNANTGDGNTLVFQVQQKIKNIEKLHDDFRKNADCDCHVLKPKYLLIGHSQGNFFVEDIALALPDEVKSRTSILSIASFTSYESIRAKVKAFDYLLRPDDFPLITMKWVNSIEARKDSFSQEKLGIGESISQQIALGFTGGFLALAKKVNVPGNANLSALNDIDNNPLLKSSSLSQSDLLKEANFVLMLDAHLIENYIGDPTMGAVTIPSFDAMRTDGKRPEPRYKNQLTESYNKAKNKLKMLTEYDGGEYEKKKECSPQVEQTPQPQQTAQKPSITVTISGPNVIEVNEKTTVEVKFVDPACRATSVTLGGPSLALPFVEKPIPAESACGGTISFTVGSIYNGGCKEHENVFSAAVSGVNLSAYSPPVTVKHQPGGLDYWDCYAWPLK